MQDVPISSLHPCAQEPFDDPPDGPQRKSVLVYRLVPASWLLRGQPLLALMREIRLEVGSFLRRIRTLSARTVSGVDLGPMWDLKQRGHRPIPNARTLARIEGIQALTSRFQAASNTDRRIFLVGFDAGERFALRKDISEMASQTGWASSSFQLKGRSNDHAS
jgi:hypothetical protein